jgi:hypothetical protein
MSAFNTTGCEFEGLQRPSVAEGPLLTICVARFSASSTSDNGQNQSFTYREAFRQQCASISAISWVGIPSQKPPFVSVICKGCG